MIIMMDNGTSRCMARDNVKSAYHGVANSCDCYTITITSQINNPGLTQRSEDDELPRMLRLQKSTIYNI